MKTAIALLVMLAISPQLHASDSKMDGVSENLGQVQEVLVLGAVNNPGFHPITQGVTIRLKAAIVLAGGLTDEADKSNIRILRPKLNESGTKIHYITLSPKSLDSNLELKPEDIVYVPTTGQSIVGLPE